MGHGTPIVTIGDDGAGVSGAFMLDAHISSTRHIARFWGLAPLMPVLLKDASQAAAIDDESDDSVDATAPQPVFGTFRVLEANEIANAAGPATAIVRSTPRRSDSLLYEALHAQMDLTTRMMMASAQWWWPFAEGAKVPLTEAKDTAARQPETAPLAVQTLPTEQKQRLAKALGEVPNSTAPLETP